MSLKILNYYGYSKETYRNCLELIRDANLHHAKMLNLWFTFLSIALFFLSRLDTFAQLIGNPMVYFWYFVLALCWEIVVFFVGKTKKFGALQIWIAVIMNVILLVSFGIYSSVAQPYMSASILPVVLVVVAISYTSTFFLTAFVLVVSGGLLIWSSYIFKPIMLMNMDVYNVFLILTLAVVLHYSIQKMRLTRFVIYYENETIHHDLVVRSSFDALTSLLNRGRFFSIASEIIRGSHDDYIVLCLMDLDGFKQINDKLGHQMGDRAIQIAGESILECFGIDFGEKWNFEERAVREKLSFAGRLGGDEYIVLLRGRKDKEEVRMELNKLLQKLAGVRDGGLKGIYSSVGVVELSSLDKDIDIAYAKADEALYQSKDAGKHIITFHKDCYTH